MKCAKTTYTNRYARGVQGRGFKHAPFVFLQDVMARWSQMQNRMRACMARAHARVASEKGQGTTEYAILVGVLVVIAIVAITVFKPKIEELWNAIASGINGL